MQPNDSSRRDPLPKAIWNALTTLHSHLAVSEGTAARYPAEIGPFAGIHENSAAAMADLRGLLAPKEFVYLMGDRPAEYPGLRSDGIVPCLQMLFPETAHIPEPDHDIEIIPLDCGNAPEMLELIAVAFPGYFRAATCRMGSYFGVRASGQLIAMGGERFVLEAGGRAWREISGLCTRPGHTGKGLGAALLFHLLRAHRAACAVSWLHVVDTNKRAIDLYHHLGFVTLRQIDLHRVVRET